MRVMLLFLAVFLNACSDFDDVSQNLSQQEVNSYAGVKSTHVDIQREFQKFPHWSFKNVMKIDKEYLITQSIHVPFYHHHQVAAYNHDGKVMFYKKVKAIMPFLFSFQETMNRDKKGQKVVTTADDYVLFLFSNTSKKREKDREEIKDNAWFVLFRMFGAGKKDGKYFFRVFYIDI